MLLVFNEFLRSFVLYSRNKFAAFFYSSLIYRAGFDRFNLAEERTIVSYLLAKNYAVLAPHSENTDTG